LKLLEQIYDSATVRLAPNDAESAKITFDPGVAQGSTTTPQLFNIFINALLRMLTVTGQNQEVSHGLQIGKNQEDSSQDADHSYQFHNISFIDGSRSLLKPHEECKLYSTLCRSSQHGVAWRSTLKKKLFCLSLTRIESEGKAC